MATIGPDFIAAAQRAEGATFSHRHSKGAPWEPYTDAQCAQILAAMSQSPFGGKMPLMLGTAQFEIRWGTEAKSNKVAYAETGILQVNLRSENSRDVKADVAGAAPARPHAFKRAPSFIESGFGSRKEYEAALSNGMSGHEDELVPIVPAGAIAHAHWFWQEDPSNIGKHHESDVKQPGNWVRYAGTVCPELDAKYQAWVNAGSGGTLSSAPIDLTDRIGSTGTEQKAHNAHTGCAFEIDFLKMVQRNVKSGYSRKVERDEFQPAGKPHAPPMPAGHVDVHVTVQAPGPVATGPIGVDTTGDGIKDSVAVDSTGDGVPDLVVRNPQMAALQAGMAGMGMQPGMMPPPGGMMPPPGAPMMPPGGMMPPPGAPMMPPGGPPMIPPGGPRPQLMRVAVPPGLQGGMTMQVHTPMGLMNVPIPPGLQPGQEFEFAM